MSELLQEICNLEHVIDRVLPTMLAAETILLDIEGHQLKIQTPQVIASFANSIHHQCYTRIQELEAEADKCSAQRCLFSLIDEEGAIWEA